MLKKRTCIMVILLIFVLLLFTGCSVRKNVKIKEVKEFTNSILESNEKIKELDFYFVRPYLGSHLVYDGDLDKDELQNLTDEFMTLIDVEFMKRIGDKYQGAIRPSAFKLYIYIDTMDNKREGDYDFKITSRYSKTHIHDEEADNIDGYETWYIGDKVKGESWKSTKDGLVDNWGIQLYAINITPTGMTLECSQLGGMPPEDLQTGTYYFIEKQINNQWVAVEMLPSEYDIAWDSLAWIIPIDETVEWEVNWEWLYGELSEGNYRIGKWITDYRNTGDNDTKLYYANFEITN